MVFFKDFELFNVLNLLGAFILTSLVYFLKQNKKKLRREWCASLFDGPNTIPCFGNALAFMLHPEGNIPIFLTNNYFFRLIYLLVFFL